MAIDHPRMPGIMFAARIKKFRHSKCRANSRIRWISKSAGACAPSQEKLGNQLALTFQQIQKYENGTNRIGAGRLQRIAQILGVSVSALYPDPVPAGQNSQEVAELIDTGSTLRLLRAYSRMRSPSLQRALTTLVEEIAEKS